MCSYVFLRLAAVRETQQVALDNELLEILPQLYTNREEQLFMQLECSGKGGQPCQGPAHITVTVCYTYIHLQISTSDWILLPSVFEL